MLIAGRRGDVARWQENTIPSLLSAAELGADAIEFDLRRSASGSFYLLHDAAVDRTTDGSGLISGMPDDRVRQLRIDGGLGYRSQVGLTVPELREALGALSNYRGLLLFDVKDGAEAHTAIVRIIHEFELNLRSLIKCDTAEEVRAVRSAGQIPTYGPYGTGADMASTASPLPWSAWFLPIDVSAIQESWTGDETAEIDRARRWGVRIYITNDLPNAISFIAPSMPESSP